MRALAMTILSWTLMIFAACSPLDLPADPQRVAAADAAYRNIVSRKDDVVIAGAVGELADPGAGEVFDQIRAYVPAGAPPDPETISFTHQRGTGGENYGLVQQYTYPEKMIILNTVQIREGQEWKLAGLHVNNIDATQIEANRLTIISKTPLHYVVLAAAVIIPLFILATVGTALYRRRWAWAFLSLFGVAALRLNWTTGGWEIQPLNIQFLGAGFLKLGIVAAPWILSVAFPLGAVLFWSLKKYRIGTAAMKAGRPTND